MLRTSKSVGIMSKAKRRRKTSVSLMVMTVVPLVSGVSLQELGAIPLKSASTECASILDVEIPGCTANGILTICSTDCQASFASFLNTARTVCSDPILENQLAQLVASSGQLRICTSSTAIASSKISTSLTEVTTILYTTLLKRAEVDVITKTTTTTITESIASSISPTDSQTHSIPSSTSLSTLNISITNTTTTSLILSSGSTQSALMLSSSTSTFVAPFNAPTASSQSVGIAVSSPLPPQTFRSAASTISISIAPSNSSSKTSSMTTAINAPFVLASALTAAQSPTTFTINVVSASSEVSSTQSSSKGAAGLLTLSTATPISQSPNSMMTFMLQPTSSNAQTIAPPHSQPQPISLPPSQSQTLESKTSSTSTSTGTLNAINNGGLPGAALATDQQSTKVNPSIIGGVVGGGLVAVGAITAVVFLLFRRRRQQSDKGGARRPISSWDFIDRNRGRLSSEPSDADLPQMSYFDQPILFDQRVQGLAVPQEVVIKRKSGPPVRVSRQSNGSMAGIDESTIEAVRLQRKTQNTMSQYSNGSIIVSYAAARIPSASMPVAPAMPVGSTKRNSSSNNNGTNDGYTMSTPKNGYGSPGPTVYNGVSQRQNENPRTNNISVSPEPYFDYNYNYNYNYNFNYNYKGFEISKQQRNSPSPIDEMLEVSSNIGGSRLGFYDKVMEDPRLQNYRPNRS
ncbi:uncharacterized protein PV09_08510 [Verruconis gallopava]|uniref:Uncharacterized protein n=1 Tax=Verruconis gallopava TaxID=253628 RepID=A0A0D1YGC0_9PEZI|nr:uncharacterized protein PV09_08510 [Verruconis gallopava]KIV99841.1 hypothetical protein PV09_08510 [Verruconis gallopava]